MVCRRCKTTSRPDLLNILVQPFDSVAQRLHYAKKVGVDIAAGIGSACTHRLLGAELDKRPIIVYYVDMSTSIAIYDPNLLHVQFLDTVESRGITPRTPLGSPTTMMLPTGVRVPANGQECYKNGNGRLVPTGNYRRNGYLVWGPQHDQLVSAHKDSALVWNNSQDIPPRLANTPEEVGLVTGRPLHSQKRRYVQRKGGRGHVPLTGQDLRYVQGLGEQGKSVAVGTGNFYQNGWLVAGPAYDEAIAIYNALPLAERSVYAFGRFLRAVLTIVWRVLTIVGVLFLAYEAAKDLEAVQQTLRGPNSIVTTNANINSYIAGQQGSGLMGPRR